MLIKYIIGGSMYTNRELFKIFMMEEYGFNNNVDFDKLRKYLLFLRYNKKAYNMDEIAEEIGVSKPTLIGYNSRLMKNVE